MTARRPLPRTIRGGRPVFFDDPAVDKVLAMLLDLSSEVWALRERLVALEAVARTRGVLLADELDRHEFSAEDAARLDAQRREFIEGLFRVLKVEGEKRGEEALARDAAAPARGQPATAAATRSGKRRTVSRTTPDKKARRSPARRRR